MATFTFDQRELVDALKQTDQLQGNDGDWIPRNAEQLTAVLDELEDAYGEDSPFVAGISAAIRAQLGLADAAGIDLFTEVDGKAPTVTAVMIDGGAPKAATTPKIGRKDDDVVLAIGDGTAVIEVDGRTFTVGRLKGDLEGETQKRQDGSEYTTWIASLRDNETGDRYKVQVKVNRDLSRDQVEDARDEDRLIEVLDAATGGGSGRAVNMAALEVGKYPVIEIKKIDLPNGQSFYVLGVEVDGKQVEVKSRRDIDALLKAGLNLADVAARGRRLMLHIFSKEELANRPGVFSVSCTLKPEKQEQLAPAKKAAGTNRVKNLLKREEVTADL